MVPDIIDKDNFTSKNLELVTFIVAVIGISKSPHN